MSKEGECITKNTGQERQLWMDYLKAVACIAVLVFHVIYGLQNAGIPTNTFNSTLKEFCDMFQIPLFMMASGYLYGIRKTPDKYFSFEGRKLINLGIPYILFSYIYIGINTIFSSQVNFSYSLRNVLRVPIEPVAQYWFLFALILIFIFVPLFEYIFKNEYIVFVIFLIWKIAVINMLMLGSRILNIDYYVAGYGVFFYLGVLYARKHDKFIKLRESKVIFSLIFIYAALFVLYESCPIANTRINDIVRFSLNILVIVTLTLLFEKFWKKFECGLLKIISKYSFQIYLIHTMATAACRILLMRFGIFNDVIHCIIGITVGLCASIFAAYVCEKTKVLNVLFFPISTYNKLKNDNSK